MAAMKWCICFQSKFSFIGSNPFLTYPKSQHQLGSVRVVPIGMMDRLSKILAGIVSPVVDMPITGSVFGHKSLIAITWLGRSYAIAGSTKARDKECLLLNYQMSRPV